MGWPSFLGGLGIGEAGWAEWAESPVNATPAAVWASATAYSSTYVAIARLRTGTAAPNGEIAYWAYFNGQNWGIPADRFGSDRGARDQVISANDVQESTIYPQQGTGDIQQPVNGEQEGEWEGIGAMFGFRFGRVRPKVVTQRRCPGGMRLGKDGWCYPTAMLPRAARMNQQKKAPVSWSDANHIRKGRSASKRIKKLADDAGKDARELAPPPRRRRRKTEKALTASDIIGLLGKGK